MAGDELHTAGRHCQHLKLAGVQRKTRYGPLFAKPIAWGDRGRVDELTKVKTSAGRTWTRLSSENGGRTPSCKFGAG